MSIIQDKNYDLNQISAIGSKYLLANGYFGYRGTMEEDGPNEFVAVNLNGLFEKNEGKSQETVNAFNPFMTKCFMNETLIQRNMIIHNSQTVRLNLALGLFNRKTIFDYQNAKITIVSERFIDQANKHMIYSRYTISSDKEINIEMINGIDLETWNLQGSHLIISDKRKDGQKIIVSGKTKSTNKKIIVGLMSIRNFRHRDKSFEDSYFKYEMTLEPGKEYEIIKYACIMHSEDASFEKADELLENAKALGFETLLSKNKETWDKIWDDARIEVVNNSLAQRLTQYALFQLVQHRPLNSKTSIPFKGLSGQFSNSSINWLNEFLIFPFYLNTFPKSAKHMLVNRINGLKEAKKLANKFGYEGAFYPYFADVFGKPTRPDLEVKEFIHVGAMIIYALYDYYFRTDDYDILRNGGLEMALECAKLYVKQARLNDTKTHYDFPNVSGIDSNHYDVTNSAFTNRLIKHNFDVLLKMIAIVKYKDKKYWQKLFDDNDYHNLIKDMRQIRRKFYLKNPNTKNVMEQFDEYFKLEDITISEWKKLRRRNDFDPTLYQVSENPEVFALSFLFPDEYNLRVKKANYEYYFNRLSSRLYISKTMSLLMACEIGNLRRAYRQFLKLAELDIEKTDKFYQGLDIINCAAIYISLVYGFAGLRFKENIVLNNLWLPKDIRRLEFHLKHNNNKGFVKVKRNISSIEWE